jgi:hypothetical protein
MRVYWVDAGQDVIMVSELTGEKKCTLIDTELDQPHDIVVDPQSGYVVCPVQVTWSLRSLLFWYGTQYCLVVSYRCFSTAYWSNLQTSSNLLGLLDP